MNNKKDLDLAVGIIRGIINFHGARTEDIKPVMNTAIKTVLGVPCGLKKETAARSIAIVLRKPSELREEFLYKICRLLKKDGIVRKGKRFRIEWSDWYWDESYLVKKITELEIKDDEPKTSKKVAKKETRNSIKNDKRRKKVPK